MYIFTYKCTLRSEKIKKVVDAQHLHLKIKILFYFPIFHILFITIVLFMSLLLYSAVTV